MRIPLPDASPDDFRDAVRRLAETTMRGLAPDADPQPLLCVYRPQDRGITAIPIPDHFMGDSTAKKALISRVVLPLIAFDVAYVAITTSAWVVSSGSPAGREVERRQAAGEPIPWLPELGLEGVGEDFAIWILTADGATGSVAHINRTAVAPPTLTPWEEIADVTGRWADPVVKALQEVRA